MLNFIETTSNLNDKEINNLLYYYQQGINIGKEEILVQVVNNLNNLQFDLEEISKITNLSINKIKQYIN